MRDEIYELKLSLSSSEPGGPSLAKETLTAWLVQAGYPGYVEAFVDGVEVRVDEADEQLVASPVVVYEEDETRAHALVRRLEDEFGSALSVTLTAIPNQAWQEPWEEGEEVFVTSRFVVRPPSVVALPEEERGERRPLVIGERTAFGTGQHATTLACLEALEKLSVARGARLLDVGTGTGILAIAAGLLGYEQVVATDIDAAILTEAAANAALNAVTIDLVLCEEPPENRGRFEVIVANILVPVLHDLMPVMARLLKDDGRMLLAGLIEKDLAALAATSAACGLGVAKKSEVRGWLCVELVKR